MSSSEDKLEIAAAKLNAELAKIKSWYQQRTLYIGYFLGVISGGALFHWMSKL